jgi:predicted site-specific integrase-resolvase
MEQIEGKNYLTITEIMERLKVCRQTVMKYKKDKKLDFIMLRGKVYITEESYKSLFIPESERSK